MDANLCVTKLFVEVKFSFILFSINEMNVPKNSSANFKESGCNVHVHYGNTGCGVFKRGIINQKYFLHKNQHTRRKLLNFENWTNGEPQQLAKIRFCKVDYFILQLFLMPKLRSVAQNEWKKHPYIFSTFRSKINKFGRKKLEKS